jgi:hypothetical protein
MVLRSWAIGVSRMSSHCPLTRFSTMGPQLLPSDTSTTSTWDRATARPMANASATHMPGASLAMSLLLFGPDDSSEEN